MDDITPKSQSKRNPGLILALVVVAILAGYLGYWIGTKNNKPQLIQNVADLSAQLPVSKIAADSIITSQEAVAMGKISKVDSGTITMIGKDNKVAGFKLAAGYNIYPLGASPSASAKASQNIKDIQINQIYLVHLVLQDGNFVATTIQALPQATK